MRIFGREIIIRKQSIPAAADWTGSMGGWFPIVREPYAGAWQRNEVLPVENVLSNTTVFACINLIAGDIAKLDLELLEEDANGIGQKVENSPFLSVLEQPNGHQNHIQFFEQWIFSKLISGNTYVLKRRDGRNVIDELYVLDPARVRPLVSPNGEVIYEVRRDDLAGLGQENIRIPASEIIHDRMNAFYHPLWGLSPIYAAHLPAAQALRILKYSDRFFHNSARPSGILTAPGMISEEQVKRVKAAWEAGFTAENAGRVGVLGDGLKWESMTQNAVDAELVKQLEISDKKVCTAFKVPPFKIGVEGAPAYDNVEAMDQIYYSGCLQMHIESIEALMESGLELPNGYYLEFDLEDLLRMDSARRTKAFADLVGAGILAPNEARAEFDYSPVEGGDIPRMQQQMIPIDQPNPSVIKATPQPALPAPEPTPAQRAGAVMLEFRKGLSHVL